MTASHDSCDAGYWEKYFVLVICLFSSINLFSQPSKADGLPENNKKLS
jgi:hypothetical protein